jgi:hypothetical protein
MHLKRTLYDIQINCRTTEKCQPFHDYLLCGIYGVEYSRAFNHFCYILKYNVLYHDFEVLVHSKAARYTPWWRFGGRRGIAPTHT